MNKKIKQIIKARIEHYNPEKYWSKREKVVDPKSKKTIFKKLMYLKYIKKSDAFNCAFISTNINSGAVFKSRPNLPHGLNGIVIGDNVIIGKNCTIMHRVTIAEGTKDKPTTIGDNVFIGVGAVIRSSKVIGNNAKIGANAVVTHDVPDNVTVGGVPATILKNGGQKD